VELVTTINVRHLCPHVTGDAQILIMMVNCSDDLWNTSQYCYMAGQCDEILKALGRTLADVIQVAPGGILLFMPSYVSKVWFLGVLEKKELRQQIDQAKEIVEEEQSKPGRELIKEMRRKHSDGLLLGFVRGKMSESLDFPNDAVHIMMVFCIPYPSLKEADTELKMQYNDELYGSRPEHMRG
jgi:Rad3-related DNA helicase